MPDFTPVPPNIHFGVFEVDLRARELRKKGVRIKIQQQPFELLLLLLARPGQVLSRDDLRQKLWPSDVYVDFDRSVNKAMVKLREALGDSSESPLYIETLPRIGYRFIAPVAHSSTESELAILPAAPSHESFTPPEYIPSQSVFGVIAAQVETSKHPPTHALLGSQPPAKPPVARWPRIAAAALILIATSATALAVHKHNLSSAPIHSLAVLPLDNLSGDQSQDYFADGMTDELTTMLAKNSTLRIVSRTSAMQYKKAQRPLRDIARELGVEGIIEGSVNRSGDHVHMTVQLIRVENDAHLWAESYDRGPSDIPGLSREAARAIAVCLNSSVPESPKSRFVVPAAHDAYLHGRYLWFAGKNEEAHELFKKAIELQPDYAAGWQGLADYYGLANYAGTMDPAVAGPAAKAAALKAIELDDSSAQSHLSLGGALFLADWDFRGAFQEIDRAIAIEPRLAEAHFFRSRMLSALDRHAEAITSQKTAMELDPFARPQALAMTYTDARQFAAAIAEVRQRLQSSPYDPSLHDQLSYDLLCDRQFKESAEEFEKSLLLQDDKKSATAVREAFAKGGYPAEVAWQLSSSQKHAAVAYVSPVALAWCYAQLGQREQAMSLLEKGYALRDPSMLWLQTVPAFDFLHDDPRYRDLIRKIGLPPAY
jgi:TolB-like protein/DNA-binding winged helix-turn-helix (wHTH) protein